MTWQTNMDVFADFPRRCAHFWATDNHTQQAYGEQTAFYCPGSGSNRIIEEECLGDECPHCKLVQFEEYMKMMTEVNE